MMPDEWKKYKEIKDKKEAGKRAAFNDEMVELERQLEAEKLKNKELNKPELVSQRAILEQQRLKSQKKRRFFSLIFYTFIFIGIIFVIVSSARSKSRDSYHYFPAAVGGD